MPAILKNYWKETQRPVYSIALVLPFLCIYHAGTVALNATHINGADALIIRILGALSVRSMFGSALVLAIYFAVWQWRSHAGWKISRKVVLFSFLESFGLALILLLFFGRLLPGLRLSMSAGSGGIADLVLFCGAGIYEELVFRAFLLGILALFFRHALHRKQNSAAVLAAIAGALLFSSFHYVGPAGDVLSIAGFIQRFLAGLYFSILFVTRGFGITAACHAFYDILVGLVLS